VHFTNSNRPTICYAFDGLQELLTALDVQQTTISAAHLRVGQQLKQLQVWHGRQRPVSSPPQACNRHFMHAQCI
jgi:hypothetical protein